MNLDHRTRLSLLLAGLALAWLAWGWWAEDRTVEVVRCPSNFTFQRVAFMPPWIAEPHAC
jgi:hypothetical protein